jgi:transposase
LKSSYGSAKQGVIKKDVHEDRDTANVIFELGRNESLVYGVDRNNENGNSLANEYTFGNKIKMDDHVLTSEILKLFKRKDQYTAKEISYLLQQTPVNVRKSLRNIATSEKMGVNNYVWKLKATFTDNCMD